MSQPIHIKDGYNYSGYNFINGSIIPIGSMDTTPTQGSTKPVTSNGIYEADNAIDTKIGSLSSLTTTTKTDVVAAVNEVNSAVSKCETLVLAQSSVSSLPITISNAAIETDMVCLKAVLSNPAAQTGDWTVNTDTAGKATISGNISGTTNITLYMMKSR